MTAAHEYEDMHQLVDRLTPTQVRRLRVLVSQDEELSQLVAPPATASESAAVPDSLLALIGSIDGPEDLADEHDKHIRQRMRERFGDDA